MYPESDDLNDYLVSDAIVDWQTSAARQNALELTQSLTDEVDKARCLYEWLRDAIPHSHAGGERGHEPETVGHPAQIVAGSAPVLVAG